MATSGSRCEHCGFVDWVEAIQCKQCGAILRGQEANADDDPYYGASRNHKLLWRGGLGGALGAPVFLVFNAIHAKLRMGYVPYGGVLHLAALPQSLILGGVLGMAVGAVIWAFAAHVRPNPSAIARAILGACFTLALFESLRLLSDEGSNGFIAPTPAEAAVNALIYLTSFGILPAIMARPENEEAEHR